VPLPPLPSASTYFSFGIFWCLVVDIPMETTGDKALHELLSAGQIQRTGKGLRGNRSEAYPKIVSVFSFRQF
jgi:hypothetical protein